MDFRQTTGDEDAIYKCIEHLSGHNLWGKETETQPNVDFTMPPLHGASLDQHFHYIAEKQSAGYLQILQNLLSDNKIPNIPKQWNYQVRSDQVFTEYVFSYNSIELLIFSLSEKKVKKKT